MIYEYKKPCCKKISYCICYYWFFFFKTIKRYPNFNSRNMNFLFVLFFNRLNAFILTLICFSCWACVHLVLSSMYSRKRMIPVSISYQPPPPKKKIKKKRNKTFWHIFDCQLIEITLQKPKTLYRGWRVIALSLSEAISNSCFLTAL